MSLAADVDADYFCGKYVFTTRTFSADRRLASGPSIPFGSDAEDQSAPEPEHRRHSSHARSRA
jgi:hypothetical protein